MNLVCERGHIQFVDLLAQDHSFASAQSLSPLVTGKVLVGEIRFRQLVLLKLLQDADIFRVRCRQPVREILVSEV